MNINRATLIQTSPRSLFVGMEKQPRMAIGGNIPFITISLNAKVV